MPDFRDGSTAGATEHHILNRRTFLQDASRVGALAMAASSWSRVMGANDRIQLGAVGVGYRGKLDLSGFTKNPGVEVRALCDVWGSAIDQTKAELPPATKAKGYDDYRKMIAGEKLDALLVATPDHWHVPIAIDAMNAGLDVYVEKPLMLNLEEGPRVVKAARANGRICQVGTQGVSAVSNIQLKQEIFDTGKLGKVTLVRTWYNGNTYHARQAPADLQKKPDNLDWVKWLGPARWREWDPQQYWNWRAYLDFGGGQIGDLYVHQVALAHFLLGIDNPISAVAAGGVLYYKDGRTAPDNVTLAFEYANDCVITYEGSIVPGARGRGLQFFGSEGSLRIDSEVPGSPVFIPTGPRAKPVPVSAASGGGDSTADHAKNFLDCMRSRKLPNADVYIGQRTSQAALLGKVAYVEQRRVRFDPVREEVLPVAWERRGNSAVHA